MATGEYAAAWDARNAANKLRERERISAEERTFDAPESTLATSQLLARHDQEARDLRTTQRVRAARLEREIQNEIERRGYGIIQPRDPTEGGGGGEMSRWLAERERKANKRALGPLRRARKELEWIVKRRSAQIANYRRDRKIEIEEQREAMAQAKVASYGVAAKDRKDATSKSETNATPIDDAEAIIERSKAISRLPPRVSVPDTKFNCRSSAGGRRTTRGGRKKKTSAALPWVTVPSTGAGAKNETSDDSRRFVNQRSVWVAPGVFVQMRTDDTKVPRDAARRNAEVFGGAPYDAGEEEARKQRRRSDVPQFFK